MWASHGSLHGSGEKYQQKENKESVMLCYNFNEFQNNDDDMSLGEYWLPTPRQGLGSQ